MATIPCVRCGREAERQAFKPFNSKKLQNNFLVMALQMVVDTGEAEAIALASEKNCLLISDDKQARAAAKRLGVSVIGTAGILIRAKQMALFRKLNRF